MFRVGISEWRWTIMSVNQNWGCEEEGSVRTKIETNFFSVFSFSMNHRRKFEKISIALIDE